MAKAKKYKPLKDFLSVDTTLIQASSLLDIAAQQAIDDGDIKSMKSVARSWLELGAVMNQFATAAEEEETEEQHDVTSQVELGFRPPAVVEEDEEEYEEPEFKIGFRGI